VEVAFGALGFLVALHLAYLLTCVVAYHRFLRRLQSEKIYFSLVQHPKLSIRYLAHLGRRVSFPLLLVYTLTTFTLYLGPFLANEKYIAALSALLVFVCATYYGTIFLIRRLIIQNKWQLISQFSGHFDDPFQRLIERARSEDLKRLRELLEMRDFLDSLDVWAERKPVLAATSLFYVAVLLLATIGMSFAMTRHVMPRFSRAANLSVASSAERVVDLGAQPPGVSPALGIDVQDVDDTVLVLWGETAASMTNRERCRVGRSRGEGVPGDGETPGFRRCDWANGRHGSLDLSIPLGEETHVLVVAYNKVYRGFFGMGGGKFSFGIHARSGGRSLVRVRRFVRINTPEIGYAAYIVIRRENDRLSARVLEGKEAVLGRLGDFLAWIEGELGSEEEARAQILPPR
jgi:hypothetical protein